MQRVARLLLDYGYVLLSRLRTVRYGLRAPDWRSGDLAPVLLLPGVFETWHYLKDIGDRLNAEGHPVHVVEPLGFNRRPIGASAELVHDYLREQELEGVVVVAHSKGGLIGKLAMVNDTEGRIERMIAVNSPFSGSPVARYAIGREWREFRPDNPTLGRLMHEQEVNSRITSVFSDFDQYIPNGSELPGAENLRLPLVGHFRLLQDPAVIDVVMTRVTHASR